MIKSERYEGVRKDDSAHRVAIWVVFFGVIAVLAGAIWVVCKGIEFIA